MSWGRLDDGLHDHEKFIALGPVTDPTGLWTLCFSWTHSHYREHATPGFVPAAVPSRFAGTRAKGQRLADRLVEARLWTVADNGAGWVFHDWLDYAGPDERAHFEGGAGPSESNKGTKATSPETAEKLREAGRRGGRKSGEARRGATKPEASNEASKASGFAKPEASAEASRLRFEASEASGFEAPEARPEASGFREASPPEAFEASGFPKPEAVPEERTARVPADAPASEPPPDGRADQRERPQANAKSGLDRGARRDSATHLGNVLVDEHVRAHSTPVPSKLRAQLYRAADEAVRDGTQEDVIRSAFALMRERPHLGPGLLPNLIYEVQNPPPLRSLRPNAPPGTESRRMSAAEHTAGVLARARARLNGDAAATPPLARDFCVIDGETA